MVLQSSTNKSHSVLATRSPWRWWRVRMGGDIVRATFIGLCQCRRPLGPVGFQDLQDTCIDKCIIREGKISDAMTLITWMVGQSQSVWNEPCVDTLALFHHPAKDFRQALLLY